MPTLVDTSTLLRLRDPADPRNPHCRAVLTPSFARAHDLRVCAQVLIEYWVVATRPSGQNGFGLTPEQASRDVTWLRSFLLCLPEPPDIADRWFTVVTTHRVSGKPAHDARLVALMESQSITRLLTLNPADFTRYSHLTCVSPADLLSGPP